jgi:Phosphotransferase enzyme family
VTGGVRRSPGGNPLRRAAPHAATLEREPRVREQGVSDELRSVLRQVNARHGTALVLGERFRRGEQGAFRLRDAAGGESVLKWRPGERDLGRLPVEVPLLDRLRSRGYPIPRYVAWGVLETPPGRYTVQQLLPGQSAWGIAGQALEDALALNDLQAGAAASLLEPGAAGRPAYEPWRRLVPRLALEGGDGFCHLEAMRAYSTQTAALLARVQAYVASRAARLARRPAGDVVHFDFGGPNILVDGGRVTGVVDWGSPAVPGDRTFDLATLLFYDGYYADVATTRARVWARALELVDAETFGVYLHHMVHRQTDWSIRHHDAAAVARVLEVGRAVLDDLAARLP